MRVGARMIIAYFMVMRFQGFGAGQLFIMQLIDQDSISICCVKSQFASPTLHWLFPPKRLISSVEIMDSWLSLNSPNSLSTLFKLPIFYQKLSL